jgi:hypothetical protein
MFDETTTDPAPPDPGARRRHSRFPFAMPPVALQPTGTQSLRGRSIIASTLPIGMQFSHPSTDAAPGNAPVRDDKAHENLFREPEFAPGTVLPEPVEPAPIRRTRDAGARARRPQRRRTAA